VSDSTLSFIGLGKLGLPLATCLAESGMQVLGLDSDINKIYKLQEGNVPFYEADLQQILDVSKKNFLKFSNDISDAIKLTDRTLVLINTQFGDDGYDSSPVISLFNELATALAQSSKDYHLFILSSTIPPGSCSEIISIIERVTGRKLGVGFGFSYVPDFVRLGSVIYDFKNPDFFLVGSSCDRDMQDTLSIFKSLHQNNPLVKKLTISEAEIAKIALNAYIVAKISFVNHLGMLCENIANVDVHAITNAIGVDKRISPYFFRAGTPFGGTCFPRDVDAYLYFSRSMGFESKTILFASETNGKLLDNLYRKLREYKNIAILGISFKPGTTVVAGSPSLSLIKLLAKKQGIKLNVHDFLFKDEGNNGDFREVFFYNSAQDCVDESEAIIVMHLDKRYAELNFKSKYVLDPWGVLDK
jgi:UDPglucose 6-dehydrogenase